MPQTAIFGFGSVSARFCENNPCSALLDVAAGGGALGRGRVRALEAEPRLEYLEHDPCVMCQGVYDQELR